MRNTYRVLVGYETSLQQEEIFVALEKRRVQLSAMSVPDVTDISALPEGYVSFSLYVKGDQSMSNVTGKLWDILPDVLLSYMGQNLIITKMR